MTNEEKERRKVILEYVQKVAERLTNSQSRAMDNLIDKMDKRITKKLETACRKVDRKSTRLNSSHIPLSRMPSSA